MDEVEFLRTYNRLRTMITQLEGEQLKVVLLTVAVMLDGLSQRITEIEEAQDNDT